VMQTNQDSRIRFECNRSCPAGLECRFRELLAQLGPTQVFSHITEVKVVVKDLAALKSAARAVGLTFMEGQRTYRWYGRSVGDYPTPKGMKVSDLGKCDHALVIAGNPRAYEIGVRKQANGSFTLVWDFWQGGYGLQALVGDDAKKLTEEYAIAAAKNACKKLGWISQVQRDGKLRVYHPKQGTLTVSRDGTVEASGFVGSTCLQAAAPLIDALGVKSKQTMKQQVTQVQQNINIGS
jgi:hypothetical protein